MHSIHSRTQSQDFRQEKDRFLATSALFNKKIKLLPREKASRTHASHASHDVGVESMSKSHISEASHDEATVSFKAKS